VLINLLYGEIFRVLDSPLKRLSPKLVQALEYEMGRMEILDGERSDYLKWLRKFRCQNDSHLHAFGTEPDVERT